MVPKHHLAEELSVWVVKADGREAECDLEGEACHRIFSRPRFFSHIVLAPIYETFLTATSDLLSGTVGLGQSGCHEPLF